MKFRTQLPIPNVTHAFSHQDTILCMGSCFAQNIGQQFSKLKFPTLINPFGILYNPMALSDALNRVLSAKEYTKSELIEHNGLWHSFDHHSQFSHSTIDKTIQAINTSFKQSVVFLQQTNRLLLTLGTAHVYEHKTSQRIVANCHKIPNQEFQQTLLSIPTIVTGLNKVLTKLKTIRPLLEVSITVSPIRHIRLGLVENQRSKAALLVSTHQLCDQLDFVHYFPAYELMMDDLRDYRFYESDMLHPNQQAINYIWQHFADAYIRPESSLLIQQIEAIQRASTHRPFNPDSEQHQTFIQTYLQKIETLENQYPFLNFQKERMRLVR